MELALSLQEIPFKWVNVLRGPQLSVKEAPPVVWPHRALDNNCSGNVTLRGSHSIQNPNNPLPHVLFCPIISSPSFLLCVEQQYLLICVKEQQGWSFSTVQPLSRADGDRPRLRETQRHQPASVYTRPGKTFQSP
ncbi:hypothetical protein F7725_018410 [Dissostichus mawsoni]|uniref:Uncharacterized protein n=1 Tax=Dissostichus mawsoni TaxID=36200 RepID=A0A7J5XS96_DISMA|nr:hypothetical protein F7725_018410 [Dissostichus mawsoni]